MSIGGFRYGAGGVIWGNRLGAGDHLLVAEGREGQGHDVRGNLVGGEIRVFAGSSNAAGARIPAADHVTLVRNQAGRIVLGHLEAGHSLDASLGGTVDHARAYANGAAVVRAQVDLATLDEDLDSAHGLPAPLPTAVLGDSDVGPQLTAVTKSITAGADSATMTTGSASIDLNVLSNDVASPTGNALKITSDDLRLISGAGGSGACTVAVINGGVQTANNVRITRNGQGASTVTSEYRPRFSDDSYVHPSWVRITLTISTVSATARIHQPIHRPTTEAEIELFEWSPTNTTPPMGNFTKYLQIVWPNEAVTRPMNLSGLKYKGVFEIGGLFTPRPSSSNGGLQLWRQSGGDKVGDPLWGFAGMLERSFLDPGSSLTGGARPYQWTDGILATSCSASGDAPGVQMSCWHGDWFKTGIRRGASGYENRSSDCFIMRTDLTGTYFFSEYAEDANGNPIPGGGQQGHSDIMQNESLCLRSLNVWKCRIQHHGQIFFLTPDQSLDAAVPPSTYKTPNGKLPRDTYVEISYLHTQMMPWSPISTVFPNMSTSYKAIATTQVRSTNASAVECTHNNEGGQSWKVPAARYYPIFIGPECYLENTYPGCTGTSNDLIGFASHHEAGKTWDTVNKKMTIGADKRAKDAGLHDYPFTGATQGGMWSRPAGSFRNWVWTKAPATPMVASDERGLGRRITSKADLLTYLNNGT